MEEEIAKKKLKLKEEIATYKGNDPLKLRYDFLVWLDTTYGKDSCSNHFNALLQDTLQVFWNSNYYSNDERFIQLLVFYTEMQPNPLEVFVKSVKKGVGVKSSQFYASWANEFCKVDNYQEADRIFNLGFSNNAAPKDVLENLYKQFLQTIGKKYLRGELTNDVNTKNLVCSKCSSQVQQNGEAPPVSTPQDYNIEDPVQCWEMNPLKVGDPDYFSCAVVYLEPKDPVKVAMYPKDLVYASEKEISLEEIKARNYLNKLDTIMAVDDIILEKKPQKEEENSNTKKDRSSHLSSTQCGDITKEAMNIIEEMWYSHGLPPGCPNKFTSSEPPAQSEPFKVYDDETPLTIRQKTNTPFTVCTEDSKSENCDPENKLKGLASIKKTQPSIPRVNVLSERKIDPTPALVERPSIASQKLNFGPMDADGRLSEKLSHASIKNNPLVGITELDDGCDDTCNTKAFAFVLPSSTPVHQKKSATSGQNASNKNDGSYIEESNDKNDRKTQQELSVILEASKERYSSSSSSNGSSNPRTPGFLARPDIIRPLKYDNIEDPFCPKLIDSFLNQMKFPLPYQSAQYHIMKGNVPNMTKSVKIGEESYNILSELGKGAYARVVKARYGNKECALKVEKPACKWEYYIAKELQRRIVPQMRNAFMIVDAAYVYQNGSILRMNWAPYGTLLTLITEHKQKIGKMLDLFVIIHFAIEMIDIVDSLHKAKIIHGDIKPDNFVLKHLPVENETESCIQLIDFGRSIDMTLFPEGTQFKHVVTTDGFQCNEMKENKPWTYQTDLYGLAGSLHCLLVGNYMKVVKKNNEWKLMQLLPRNVRRELWDPIFHKLLNTNSSNCLPNLEEMKHRLHQELNGYGDNFVFSTNLKQLHNLMNGS
ncbi:mitotic checkpoint serine/threonine-protein kinase BUB1 beta-like isoform X3 [Cimex lectularius]|uniref:Mitotic checkpoint serine/threonine-protein kinase BUB1 n=1 Tax=Cimex lectularius TaxID=79782 RepID=A0A8I6RKF4_CIMLE|nr:mitotic checkpoint serine/threonine-protein kinase BUB1 beta-like isoform X3 [Cimex lectularius]